jgi:hypothetical protein
MFELVMPQNVFIAHAVEYYEYALQKNPKIPVKRRLNALKKMVQAETHP